MEKITDEDFVNAVSNYYTELQKSNDILDFIQKIADSPNCSYSLSLADLRLVLAQINAKLILRREFSGKVFVARYKTDLGFLQVSVCPDTPLTSRNVSFIDVAFEKSLLTDTEHLISSLNDLPAFFDKFSRDFQRVIANA